MTDDGFPQKKSIVSDCASPLLVLAVLISAFFGAREMVVPFSFLLLVSLCRSFLDSCRPRNALHMTLVAGNVIGWAGFAVTALMAIFGD